MQPIKFYTEHNRAAWNEVMNNERLDKFIEYPTVIPDIDNDCVRWCDCRPFTLRCKNFF